MVKHYILILLFVTPMISFTQVVEEIIQIDTITEVLQVIYRAQVSTTYYKKETAVFASDTSQVAIEKSFIKKRLSGVYKVYYPSGKLKIRTVYANNLLNGEWTYYDENGIIITKGNYFQGQKHGYWAYKSLNIYGRYKKGLKSWRWFKVGVNNKRIKSTYKNGLLVRGEGLGENTNRVIPVKPELADSLVPKLYDGVIGKEYEQAISFLKENLVFKKALKECFSKNRFNDLRLLKKYFVRGEFQFMIAPTTYVLDDSLFYAELVNGKISVLAIDSVLRYSSKEITISNQFPSFNVGDKLNRYPFESYSTDLKSPMTIKFGELKRGLMQVDVVWTKTTENKKFQIILYFDNAGWLKGAEYERS